MIRFFSEEISFTLRNKKAIRQWIIMVLKNELKEAGSINYIFCSDSYLLDINQRYLKHNTLTDIITFDHSEDQRIEGDIFISIDRVRDNARHQGLPFVDELHRVMVHGILHLAGYTDKTLKEKALMREKEDECLSLRY